MQKSKDSQSKPSESKESVDSQLHCNTSVKEVNGEKSANGKVCVSEHFMTLSCGPQFEVGDGYFDKGSLQGSLSVRDIVTKCRKHFHNFVL